MSINIIKSQKFIEKENEMIFITYYHLRFYNFKPRLNVSYKILEFNSAFMFILPSHLLDCGGV